MSDQIIKAIPTEYKGINFRSRLEAKWAFIFDQLKWPWEYEPFELNGYIPDFVLAFHKPIIAEIKPAVSIDELYEHTEKIHKSGWDKDAFIFGATTLRQDDSHDCICLYGQVSHGPKPGEDPRVWDEGCIFSCSVCKKLSIYNYTQSWFCTVNGCYEGNTHLGEASDVWRAIWSKSKNQFQWRAA